ncbi:flagellar biosynthesis anti-sigma factor FlgM [Psychromonas sp. SP041]|uniref:flagellar biosynthesis anti-sigma factor FlgM n=1 Tax=Psychromonas sp. SP041 TaxID=1365007 RepID=UPI00041A92C8|nr:flagellar biosynthesis anti-sigma factor FlgM [Psychromonas sp. SP041]
MSININRQAPQSNLNIEQNKAQKQGNANAPDNTNKVNSNKDSVQLTSQAVSLNNMQKQTSSESQVDMKRVETLKAAILNGDYKINSEQLAKNIGKFETDFNKAYSS